MKRQVSLEEISDGKLYSRTDMVRAGCQDCKGCSSCCSGMGNSVILDPMDIYRLTTGLGLTFEALMTDKIELNVVDGIILPNLKMSSGTETCAFLNEQGRCSIHPLRPGICRLFPLGRYYGSKEEPEAAGMQNERPEISQDKGLNQVSRKLSEERSFRYFLQVHECPMPNKTKVKVEKWVDTPDLRRYETFICDWHYFLEDVEQRISREQSDETVKNINLFLLKLFYLMPYSSEVDFYTQFEQRFAQAKEVLDLQ